MKVGEVICGDEPITLNTGRATKQIRVTNKGDRPVQVGSHFHFFEVNRACPSIVPRPLAIDSTFPVAIPSVLSRARKSS